MIGYLDAPSGISGDMFLGCLIDAGWSLESLHDVIRRLSLPEGSWEVTARETRKGSLRAMQVEVGVREIDPPHRHLSDVKRIIDESDLPTGVKEKAVGVFLRVAEAEAKVHGCSVEAVHFHEVGALDAIVDIVGAAAGLSDLGVEHLYASPLPLSRGWIDCAHGKIPLPAPATLEILRAAEAPTCPGPGEGELVTPTGAAIVAEFARFTQPPMTITKVGVGAGSRDFPWPNIARLWLGTQVDTGPLLQIDTNIDDMNPQFYETVTAKLLAAGALDVWLCPVQMKKNRPGIVLSVLAPTSCRTVLVNLILRETTTLGVRIHHVSREVAQRESRTVKTEFGSVAVKLKIVDAVVIGASPEYEDCRELAEQRRIPVRVVFESAFRAAAAFLPEP